MRAGSDPNWVTRVSIDNELSYNVLQPSDFVFNIEAAKNQYQRIIEESVEDVAVAIATT